VIEQVEVLVPPEWANLKKASAGTVAGKDCVWDPVPVTEVNVNRVTSPASESVYAKVTVRLVAPNTVQFRVILPLSTFAKSTLGVNVALPLLALGSNVTISLLTGIHTS